MSMLLLMAAMLAVSSDPARVAPIGVRPASDPGSWIRPEDYPKGALRASAAGVTGFMLMVGPDGHVRDCVVTSSSGNDGLDAATCALLGDRARFLPALNAAGQPINSTYRSSVKWVIPTPPPPTLPAGSVSASMDFDVSSGGQSSNCRTSGSLPGAGGALQWGQVCEQLTPLMIFRPPVDSSGKPVAKHVAVRIIVDVSDLTPIIDTPPPRP